MRFFRRSKKTNSESTSQHLRQGSGDVERDKYRLYNRQDRHYNYAAESSRVFAPWLKLPAPILERVFAFVCPHSCDETYETCEHSAVEGACMLCDLRDLSHAGQVCKSWRKTAIQLMYHSIRIDTVHYCEREIDLSERRKHKNRFDRNGVPEDTASARLRLLCRTLREDPTRLGKLVEYFKTPYMLRESNHSMLARTIAVLPNLKYVDLPEGLFMDDPAHHTLKLEIQARCPGLRKMTYLAGSERSLETLNRGNVWPNLEVLELGKIDMDPAVLRQVLSMLPRLRALKVSDCRMLDDDMFNYNDIYPAIPPLEELILTDVPRVTADGIVAYLSRKDTRQSLKVLSLSKTGIHPAALHDVLAHAPRLATLSITEQVDSPFPSHGAPIPPMSNWALETLRYEITGSPTTSAYASTTAGYYNYLASSLFAGGLPRLSTIYVRDQKFPDLLIGIPPPMPGFMGTPQRPKSSGSARRFNETGAHPRFSSNNPFASTVQPRPGPRMLALNQTLEIFTKGDDDLDWGSTRMDPLESHDPVGQGRGQHGRTASSASGRGRPLSSFGLAGMAGGAGARMSIIQGDGHGGFLSVPGDQVKGHARENSASGHSQQRDEWPRPNSSHGARKGDRDLWR